MSVNMSDKICVGAIAGAFGVRGEVRLKSFTAEPLDIATYGPLETKDGAFEFLVTVTGQTNNALTVRLSGINTKEQADALRGVEVFVARDRLPSLPDDEFYHSDLIGMDVFDTGGTALGRIKNVQNHGASDLLEVTLPGSSATILLPFTREAVPTVDLTRGRIVADPPEGVFEGSSEG